jgi:hypothetical protein
METLANHYPPNIETILELQCCSIGKILTDNFLTYFLEI